MKSNKHYPLLLQNHYYFYRINHIKLFNNEYMETEVVETHTQVTQEVPASTPKTYQKKKVIFRTYQIIYYIVGVIEVLLAFRIGLKMLAANPNSGFTNLIYTLTDPLAVPFLGVLRITATQGAVFEWSTFIAMAVYGLVGYGIVQLIQLIKPTNPVEVEEGVSK